MIKEALELLFRRADDQAAQKVASSLPRRVDLPGGDTTIWYEHNGQLIEHHVPPGNRSHKVDSVEDLTAAAAQWNENNVIWLDGESVVLIIDDEDRRERVTLQLKHSATFKTLLSLKDGKAFDQAAFLRLLRVELRMATNGPAILAAARKIKFRSLAQGHSDIQHGNESMGKTIENEVTGADALPEMLIVETAIYSNPGEEGNRFGIGLDLEIDAKNQRFILRPMPDELEKATASALANIRERITDKLETPVFYGRP